MGNWTARMITAEDREHYNQWISQHPKGHILQSYEWGEIKARTGWQPLRLVVEDEGRIIAAVSILKREIPFIRRTIFYAPRGPVLDLHDAHLCNFLLHQVRVVAREHRAILFKIDPDVPVQDAELREYLQRAGFRPAEKDMGFEGVQPRHVFRLDITPPEEELLANLHPKTRYNLRLAERKGVTISESHDRKDLEVFYPLLLETAKRDRFLVRSSGYFSALWDELVSRGYASLFLAHYQGEVIAGTLAFIFGDKAWYIYGASGNRHRNVMPNYLLQWTMILWAKRQGCTMYDFRGVSGDLNEDHPLYGLFRFKRGFNGVFTEFVGEFDQVFAPFYYWLWNTVEPMYSKGIRRLISLRKKTGHS